MKVLFTVFAIPVDPDPTALPRSLIFIVGLEKVNPARLIETVSAASSILIEEDETN